MRFATVAAMALAVLLAAGSAYAEAGVGTVKGSVVDKDGKGVADVMVKVVAPPAKKEGGAKKDMAEGAPKAEKAAAKSAKTDADGKYVIVDVPAGTYNVMAMGTAGAGKTKAPVTVVAGQETQVDPIVITPRAPKGPKADGGAEKAPKGPKGPKKAE